MRYASIGLRLLLGFSMLAGWMTIGCSSSPESGQERGRGASEGRASQGDIYRAELDVIDVQGLVRVVVNGFPVYETGGGHVTRNHVDPPINTALVGGGNGFGLQVVPWLLRAGPSLEVGRVHVEAHVSLNERRFSEETAITQAQVDSAYATWVRRAEHWWQHYLAAEEQWLTADPDSTAARGARLTWRDGGALDSIRAWAARHPMTVATTFDNETGPDHSAIFEDAPVLTDTSRLVDYALHLRDLMVAKDTAALFQEFELEIEGRYNAYLSLPREEFLEKNRKAIVLENAVLNFGRENVRLREWSKGRVWQIYRHGSIHEALFQRPNGYGLGKLYVAEIDGELRVVR